MHVEHAKVGNVGAEGSEEGSEEGRLIQARAVELLPTVGLAIPQEQAELAPPVGRAEKLPTPTLRGVQEGEGRRGEGRRGRKER